MTGKELRRIREKILDMTQEELARKIGASRRSIGRWENDQKQMRPVYKMVILELKKRKGAA